MRAFVTRGSGVSGPARPRANTSTTRQRVSPVARKGGRGSRRAVRIVATLSRWCERQENVKRQKTSNARHHVLTHAATFRHVAALL